jgi:foldase protein PrsA
MSPLEFFMSNPTRVVAGLATAVLGLVLAGCSGTSSGGDIASVNGKGISRADFDNKLEGMPQAKSQLNQLVQQALIDQYATDNHITVTDAEVQKKEDDIKAKYPPGQFDSILKAQNLTDADVKKILRQQAILEKAVEPNIHVTDADIKSYLAKNHASLDTAEQVHAEHILVADKKTADSIEAQLKAGAKFSDLATKYSTDPSSKAKGGDLGFFARNQMVKPFEDAAFTQKIGVVGPPVKSPFGWHIIEVLERKPAQVATLANSSDKIRDLLKQQQQQQQLPQFMQGLRAKATIVINDDRLKDALPPLPSPAASPAASAAASAAPSAAATK